MLIDCGEIIIKCLFLECVSSTASALCLFLSSLILFPANLKLDGLSFSRNDKSRMTGFFSSMIWSIM